MRRFTKILAVAVAVAGLGFASSTANAAEPGLRYYPTIHNPGPFPIQSVDYDYLVIYKPSIFSPWRVYGKFETLPEARFAERRLEWQGFAVGVERVRDYHGGWHRW